MTPQEYAAHQTRIKSGKRLEQPSLNHEEALTEWRKRQDWLDTGGDRQRTQRKRKLPTAQLNYTVCKYVIGIDPGAYTGFASFDGTDWHVKTLDFFSLMEWARAVEPEHKTTMVCIVEMAHLLPPYAKRVAGKKIAEALSIARDVGANNREAQLVFDGLKRLGFSVIPFQPTGESPKWDDEACQQITGYDKRTSEHGRDAMRFAWLHKHLLNG